MIKKIPLILSVALALCAISANAQPQGGGRPPMGGPGMAMSDEEMEKYYEKQDKKLKKILTVEQYDRWRSKHPAGRLPMPEMKFK